MTRLISRVFRTHPLLVATVLVAAAMPARATVLNYHAFGPVNLAGLSGANESPANGFPGFGTVEVNIDDVANTMRIRANFSGMAGTTTACHIHGPTAVANTGNAGVATMTPAFTGFPLGVTSGSMDHTFDLTQTSTYNAPFVTANGGTAAGAEAALLSMIAAGKAYFNIHSTQVPGGEMRGFLAPFNPVPTDRSTWSRVKALFH